MTLLELCDELDSTLIIKRKSTEGGASVKYSVSIECTKIFNKSKHSSSKHKVAKLTGKDVNQLLYHLCSKVSHKIVESHGCKRVPTVKVEKGNLSILGVW